LKSILKINLYLKKVLEEKEKVTREEIINKGKATSTETWESKLTKSGQIANNEEEKNDDTISIILPKVGEEIKYVNFISVQNYQNRRRGMRRGIKNRHCSWHFTRDNSV
jgi:hypothetical protein